MAWTTKLSRKIRLKDGTELVTLLDAGEALSKYFQRVTHSPALEHAIDLVMKAARTGKRSDVAAATDQLMIVLQSRYLLLEEET